MSSHPIYVLKPFSLGIPLKEIANCAQRVVIDPDFYKCIKKGNATDLKVQLLNYLYKEISAAQKYNVLKEQPIAKTIRQEIAILFEKHWRQFNPQAVYSPFLAQWHPAGVKILGTNWVLQSRLLHSFFPQESHNNYTPLCFLYVVTIGSEADHIIKNYSEKGQVFEAFVMNSIAAGLADTLAFALQKYLEEKYANELNHQSLHRYSPGYQDWHLQDQKIIFEYLMATDHIGVALTDSFLMTPLKSTSGIMGVKLTNGN